MIGLVVVVVFTVYLAVSIFVVRLVARKAKAKGRSPWRWGMAAGLCMYLLVFWDHIPTILLHKYYCATKAGFWVYKTPEQWKAENPGVAETLTWREKAPSYHNLDGAWGFKLNERFVWEFRDSKIYFLPVHLSSESIIDKQTGETVAKRVNVGSGYGSLALGGGDWRVLKFWIGGEPCVSDPSEWSRTWQSFKILDLQRDQGSGG